MLRGDSSDNSTEPKSSQPAGRVALDGDLEQKYQETMKKVDL
jgi:hypothetical protein